MKIKDIEVAERPREIFRRQSPLNAARRFGEMPMFKKITHALMALTMAFGMAVTAAPEAQAGHGRGLGLGIAAGIIGLGILGATANARGYGYDHRSYSAYDDDRECYRGARECHWSGRRCFENRWGDTVCRGGRYLCERPVVCE